MVGNTVSSCLLSLSLVCLHGVATAQPAAPAAPDKAAATAMAELVSNPGFEQAAHTKDGRLMPQGWRLRITGANPNPADPGKRMVPRAWPDEELTCMELTKDAARTGQYGLLMKPSVDEPRLIAQYRVELQNVDPRGRYTFSAWVRAGSDGPVWGHVDVAADLYSPENSSHQVFFTREWKQINIPFDLRKFMPTPKKGEPYAIWVRLVGWTPMGSIHWDDVSLTAGLQERRPSDANPDPDWEEQSARLKAPSPTVPGELLVEPPSLTALGFEWPIRGDYNRNGRVDVQWRKKGEADWRTGMPLHRTMWEWLQRVYREGDYICPNAYAGSVVNLEPGTEYEVRLRLTDPDGGSMERTVTARTRTEPTEVAGGRRLHVYPPEFAGQKQQPAFTGIRAAYAVVEPGDVILVHAGTYVVPEAEHVPQDRTYTGNLKEALEKNMGNVPYVFDKSGTPEKPIVIRGAGDGEAVLEDRGAKCLVDVRGGCHMRIEGLTLRGGSRHALWADDTIGLTVRRCRIETAGNGIHITPRLWAMKYKNIYGSRDCFISDNILVGSLSEIWAQRSKWQEERGGYSAAFKPVAIHVFGFGTEVCYNRVDGFYDGINIGAFCPAPNDWSQPRGPFDIHHNLITHCMDDSCELDGTYTNARFHHNVSDSSLMSVSTQPGHGGPMYIYRNIGYQNRAEPIKTHNWPAGIMAFNNTFISVTGFSKMPAMWQCSEFVNNIFFQIEPWDSYGTIVGPIGSGTPTPETCVVDHNAYRNVGKTLRWFTYPSGRLSPRDGATLLFPTPEEFVKKTGFEKHAVWGFDYGDFVNLPPCTSKEWPPYAGVDLRLKPGSKAVDAGMVIPQITDGFLGRAPDIGAYEAGAPLPHYGPRDVAASK